MTREEQIISEAKKYYSGDIKCYDAFLYGTDFADNNPDLSSLWHDASEKPRPKEWILVKFGEDDYKTLSLNDLFIDIWFDWCKILHVICWAYISDLLPKGGEK